VEGVPQNPNAVGLAAIVLGLVLGAVFLLRARRTQSLVSLTVATLALAAFPYVAWRVVEDIRYTSNLDSWLANRYGVSVFRVHPAIFDNAETHMTRDARYYLVSSPKLDATRRAAFAQWAAGWMLPRVAVASPGRADFVLALGVDPRSVGVPISHVWRVMPALQGTPAAYLGEVGR
jgi:hypothetical protein